MTYQNYILGAYSFSFLSVIVLLWMVARSEYRVLRYLRDLHQQKS